MTQLMTMLHRPIDRRCGAQRVLGTSLRPRVRMGCVEHVANYMAGGAAPATTAKYYQLYIKSSECGTNVLPSRLYMKLFGRYVSTLPIIIHKFMEQISRNTRLITFHKTLTLSTACQWQHNYSAWCFSSW